ncbi:Tricalbin-2 [Conglomerata obtusa]
MQQPDQPKQSQQQDQTQKHNQPSGQTKAPELNYSPDEKLLIEQKHLEAEIESRYRASIEHFQNCLDTDTPSIFTRYGISAFLSFFLLFVYILGRFRFSFTILLGVIYAVNLFYKRRMRKFERSLKVLIYRSTMQEKRKNNWESVEWMNYVIGKVWTVLEPTISKEVLRMVNPILQEKCPPFLSKLKLTTFTLGSNPPFVVGITSFEETDPETVMIEAEFGFVPLEMDNESYHFITKKKKYEWNSKIILVARLGTKVKGVGIDLPVLVKGISFQGRARVILNLTQDKIIVKDAEVCFMEMPEIDFTLQPLKTVDLMDVPGLSNWIHTIIETTLKSMAVNPNSIKVDLTQMQEEKSKPIGILLLRIAEVYNKESEEILAEIDIDGRKLYHTATKEGKIITLNEYFYLLVESNDNNVCFKLMSPRIGKDSYFGEGSIFLKKILKLKSHLESVKIFKKGNVRSIMNCSYDYFPIIYKSKDNKGSENKRSDNKGSDNKGSDYKPSDNKGSDNKGVDAKNKQINTNLNNNSNDDNVKRHLTNSAIIRMKVLQADDIKGLDAGKKKVYSSCFTVLVSKKINMQETEKSDSNLLNFVTGPVNATALLVGGAFTSAQNFANNIIPGQSKEDQLLPSSEGTFYLYESKTIVDTNSPFFNESCEFFVRDIRNDVIYFRLRENKEDGKVIGKLDIPIKEIQGENWYRLKDAQSGKVKINFEIDYVELDQGRLFEEFDKAVKINITNVVSIYEEGCFYCVIRTSTDTFYVEPFLVGDLLLNREIIVPCSDRLMISVYKESEKEDDFIGEGILDVKEIMRGEEENFGEEKRIDSHKTSGNETKDKHNDKETNANKETNKNDINNNSNNNNKETNMNTNKEINKNDFNKNNNINSINNNNTTNNNLGDGLAGMANEMFGGFNTQSEKTKSKIIPLICNGDENGSLYLEAEYLPLTQYKGISSGMDSFKTVQVRFSSFKNIENEFIIEFISNDEVIQRSAISRKQEINKTFLLLAGKSEIRARFRSAKIGEDKILGDCLIPKREMNERIMLDEKTFSTKMEIKVKSCGFKKKERVKEGQLQLFIRQAKDLLPIDSNGKVDPYIKIFLNGNRIHKTSTKKETLNPIFNESIALRVNSMVDVLRIEVFDWNKIQQNRMISYKEMPLYFLEEGLCDIDLHLINAKSYKKDGSILSCGFMFKKNPEGTTKMKFGGIKK